MGVKRHRLAMRALKVAIVIVVLVAVGLFSAFVWPTRYRYETLKTAEQTITIRVDRFSDKTWMLLAVGWIPQGGREKPQPSPTTKGVGARCSLEPQFGVSCDFSNETDYTVETITVDFKNSDGLIGSVTAPDGRVAFASTPVSCRADLTGIVTPHTLGTMSVKPPCMYDLKPNWTWTIVAASGLKE